MEIDYHLFKHYPDEIYCQFTTDDCTGATSSWFTLQPRHRGKDRVRPTIKLPIEKY